MKPIPLIRPLLPDMKLAMKYFRKSERSGMLTNFGPCYYKAIDMIQKKTNRIMLPVTNGTAAIQAAVAVHFAGCNRIAVPDFTHIGTINAIIAAGKTPVIFPTDILDWCISKMPLAQNTDQYDAFIVVAPFGKKVDHRWYDLFSLNYKKPVMYDFAGAWGLFPNTSNPVCYSLHATKLFTTGEGGLLDVGSGNGEPYRKYLNFGIGQTGLPEGVGYNLKMDELRCAMICAHMDKSKYIKIVEKMRNRQRAIFMYDDWRNHANFVGYIPTTFAQSLAVYPHFEVDPNKHAKKFVSKYYYPLLSRMPHLNKVEKHGASDWYFTKCLALPIDVTYKEQCGIIKALS